MIWFNLFALLSQQMCSVQKTSCRILSFVFLSLSVWTAVVLQIRAKHKRWMHFPSNLIRRWSKDTLSCKTKHVPTEINVWALSAGCGVTARIKVQYYQMSCSDRWESLVLSRLVVFSYRTKTGFVHPCRFDGAEDALVSVKSPDVIRSCNFSKSFQL